MAEVASAAAGEQPVVYLEWIAAAGEQPVVCLLDIRTSRISAAWIGFPHFGGIVNKHRVTVL